MNDPVPSALRSTTLLQRTLQAFRELVQATLSMERKSSNYKHSASPRIYLFPQCAVSSFLIIRTLRSLLGKLPGSHVEVARGSSTANYEYCTKSGDFDEFGDKPLDPAEKGVQERNAGTTLCNAPKEGKFDDVDADILIRNYGALKRIRNDFKPKPVTIESTCGYWIYGDSGCGKSYAVQQAHPDHYKKGHNKWWDGYDGEDVAYLDDLGHGDKWLGEHYLKHWADRYAFAAESKGHCCQLRPKSSSLPLNTESKISGKTKRREML